MTCRVSEVPRRLIRFISCVTLTRFQQLVRSGRWDRSCLACGRPVTDCVAASLPTRYGGQLREELQHLRARQGSCAPSQRRAHSPHAPETPASQCPARSGLARKPTWINSPARQSPRVGMIQAHWRVKITNPCDPRAFFHASSQACAVESWRRLASLFWGKRSPRRPRVPRGTPQ